MADFDLKRRSFAFAVDIGRLVMELPHSIINYEYSKQLIRCSSSVGANYRAARRAKSDADFLNKLKIVEEEADVMCTKHFDQSFILRAVLLNRSELVTT